MDTKEALHTIARRYCTEQHAYWTEAYAVLQAAKQATIALDKLRWTYTDEAYVTFPRYLVWEAIRDEVERIEPQCSPSFDELRESLVVAGHRAETASTQNPALPQPALAAMTEEREHFVRFVRSVSLDELVEVEPLPPRRILDLEEVNQLWQKLNERWGIKKGEHWWPLLEGRVPGHVLAFHTDYFDQSKVAVLQQILIDRGVTRICELREFGEWGYEGDVGALNPRYSGEEGYWTSSSLDWLVYASHQSSVTLAGSWLTQMFREHFASCERFTYGGPFSTSDQRGSWQITS